MSSSFTQRLPVRWQAFRRLLRQQIFAQLVGLLLRVTGAALFTVAHGMHF